MVQDMRTPATPISTHSTAIPRSLFPPEIDHTSILADFVSRLHVISAVDFAPEAYWRDLVALTGTIRTISTPARIAAAWNTLCLRKEASSFEIVPDTSKNSKSGPHCSWLEAKFIFKTAARPRARCSGFVRLVSDNEGERWQIWILRTLLEAFEDFELGDPDNPPFAERGTGRSSYLSNTNGVNETSTNGVLKKSRYDCIVIGAGPAGLSNLARLKSLGIRAIALERNQEIGGNWTERYESFKLHTPKEYGQLPYGRYNAPEDPYYLNAKHLKRSYQNFVEKFGLEIRYAVIVENAEWDPERRLWTVNFHDPHGGDRFTARHLIFAIGTTGHLPVLPEYPGRHLYNGIVLHCNNYKSARSWRGLKGVVIGTGTTGHDVAYDMCEAGLSSVTMVQRNPTAILLEEYWRVFFDPRYNEHSDIDASDREGMTMPYPVMRSDFLRGVKALAQKTPERFEDLERAGFRVERHPDFVHYLFERHGGHYVDIGTASKKIIEGQIKVKSGVLPKAWTTSGLVFEDGTTLNADVVVFCTGYNSNIRVRVEEMVGSEIGAMLEDTKGFDKEGEMKAFWKPAGHPAIWYSGVTINQARFFSRFLALQIKADLEGCPLEVAE